MGLVPTLSNQAQVRWGRRHPRQGEGWPLVRQGEAGRACPSSGDEGEREPVSCSAS